MNSPINTALLSYGMSGEIFHAPFLSIHSGFQLKKVVERNRKKINQHYSQVISVADKRDVFNDASIELVMVNTPNETHYPLVKEACIKKSRKKSWRTLIVIRKKNLCR